MRDSKGNQPSTENSSSDRDSDLSTAAGRGTSKRRGRIWIMRVAAILLPCMAVVSVEIAFRFAGLYEHPERPEASGGPQVMQLPSGVVYFPEWNSTLSVPKPQGTVRVFVVGGSSAMGFGVRHPFSDLMEVDLNDQFPDKDWEVVNGGVSAFASHRALAVVKRACEFEPDLILIYLGHNEFLEEVFYDPDGLVARLEQTRGFAQRIRIVNFFGSLFPKEPPKSIPKLQHHFFGNTHFPLIHSTAEKRQRIDFLKSNLRKMAAECQQHGVTLVLIPAVTNLLVPPGNPEHGWEHESGDWPGLVQRCEEALATRDYDEARDLAGRLIDLDSEHAIAHYLDGLAALGEGDLESAIVALSEANRLDYRGDRACPEIQQAILDVAAEVAVLSSDARPDFAAQLPDEFHRASSGEDLLLFMDHCHPTRTGHRLLADFSLNLVLNAMRAESYEVIPTPQELPRVP